MGSPKLTNRLHQKVLHTPCVLSPCVPALADADAVNNGWSLVGLDWAPSLAWDVVAGDAASLLRVPSFVLSVPSLHVGGKRIPARENTNPPKGNILMTLEQKIPGLPQSILVAVSIMS